MLRQSRFTFILAALIMTVIAALLAPQRKEVKPSATRERSGALEALDFWTNSRAYPDADIPAAAYYAAYVSSGQRIKDISRTTSFSGSWKPIGPINLQGRSISIALNPLNPQTVYVGSASGGLWRSTSEGSTGDWQRIALGYPALGIGAIAIDPADSNTIYVGTGEVYRYRGSTGGLVARTTRGSYGVGILKTTDGGTTWAKSLDWTTNQQRGVQKLAINPLNPNTLFAATTEGMLKSIDAGSSWYNTLPVIMGEDIVINTLDTNLVMVSMGNLKSPAGGLYLSIDAGESWFLVGGLPAYSGKTMLGAQASNPNLVFASVADSTTGVGSLWKSTDFGVSWSFVSNPGIFGVQGWYSHIVAVHPTDPLQIFHAGVPAVKTSNGGVSFGGTSGLYSDNHAYAIHPSDPDIIYVVNDDGIYRSTDFGASFINVGFGMQTGQFYNGFSNSSQDSLFAVGQSQDHIPGYRYNGDLFWGRSVSDEVGWTAIDPTNDNIVYAGSRFGGGISRSTDRGNSFGSGTGFAGSGAWNSPFVVSPSAPNILYFGDQRIYRSTTGGTSFSATNGNSPLDGNPALAMAISATNPDTLYVGMAPFVARSHFFRTADGGTSWQDITGTLPDRYPMDLAVDPTDSRVVYAAMGGFGTGHFYKSTDAGSNWSNISGTLPDVPGTAVAIDPMNTSIVYAGNDIGVYVSTDGGTSWSGFSEGLPDAVIAADLTISPANLSLRIATHGSGVYERALLGEPPANFFDYRALALNSPSPGGLILEGTTITPISATFRNNGGAEPADSVNATYRIVENGSELYASTERIKSLALRESRVVTFAGSFLPPSPGIYQMQAIIEVADSNGANDTLKGSFEVIFAPTIIGTVVTKQFCPYTDITGGAAGPSGDDAQMSTVLPFPFSYDGYAYNTIQISTNGWVELGTGTAGTERGLSTAGQLGGFFVQALGTTGRPTKVLAPWWTDMSTGSIGSITYKFTGTSPNRIATIQWKDVAANYDEGSTTMKLNFQVVLNEGTNVAEFHYGPIIAGTFFPGASGAGCGLKDHVGGDYHFYDLAAGGSGLAGNLSLSLNPVDNWPGRDSCYQIEAKGLVAVAEERPTVPSKFALHQNYPNPFNPSTTIAFDLPERAFVSLRIYDILGKEVARLVNDFQSPGYHAVPFDASGFASGVYFYRLSAGSFHDARKLLLLR